MLHNPGEILASLNQELLDQSLGKHVTVFIGVVDVQENAVAFANAGHFPHPIHARSGHANYLETHGKPVGLFDDVEYDVATAALEPGDCLVSFSDGVLDAMHEDGLAAKEERLVECAAAEAPDIGALWADIEIPEGPGLDDITCLVVERGA